MIKKLLLGAAGGLGIGAITLVGAVSMQPDTSHIERTGLVHARPEIVHGLVADFKLWPQWSPWEAMDPTMAHTYSGAEKGEGAITTWKGNSDVGEGKMTITKASPERLDILLEFVAPFAATNDTAFTFAAAEGGTQVTWIMDGENNFASKMFGMMVDMDAMIGADFERGLSQLDKVASATEATRKSEEEAAAAAAAAIAAAEPAAGEPGAPATALPAGH